MNDQPTPFISIIIPVRNAERTLDTTFGYLMNVKYPRDKMEIVIADGGSTDKTLDVIKKWQATHPFIRLVEVPNCPSPGFARNKALDVVKGEFIFFTDGDCAPCQEWITEMLKHFYKDPQIGAVGGEIYTLKVDKNNLTEAFCESFRFNMVSPRYDFIGEGYFPPLSDMSPTQVAGHRAYFFVTANVAYRKKAIDEANARFWHKPTGEDIEFGMKIRQKGWKFYFAPNARVDHMHRSDFKALKKVWITYGAAHAPLISAYATKKMEIVLQFLKKKPRLCIPFPIKGFIYIGNFQLMHIFGLLALVSLITSLVVWGISYAEVWTMVFLALTLFFMMRYFRWCSVMEPKKEYFTWCKMLYMTNLCFSRGGLKGSIKNKTFCIEPSFG